jgi:hypothetical protein
MKYKKGDKVVIVESMPQHGDLSVDTICTVRKFVPYYNSYGDEVYLKEDNNRNNYYLNKQLMKIGQLFFKFDDEE